jgi:predicted lipoprotein
MVNKVIKYLFGILCLGFICYQSIYFKKISTNKASEVVAFDPSIYARKYILNKIPSAKNKATDIFDLILALKSDPKKAFKNYSSAQNTGDLKYFFVKGQSEIIKIDDAFVSLKNNLNSTEIKLSTKYIFGNSARDCSGIISINDFTNTMDLNNVSEEINKLIRKEILPPFIAKAKKGDLISFTGALELSVAEPKLSSIAIIPLTLELKPSKP